MKPTRPSYEYRVMGRRSSPAWDDHPYTSKKRAQEALAQAKKWSKKHKLSEKFYIERRTVGPWNRL